MGRMARRLMRPPGARDPPARTGGLHAYSGAPGSFAADFAAPGLETLGVGDAAGFAPADSLVTDAPGFEGAGAAAADVGAAGFAGAAFAALGFDDAGFAGAAFAA